MVLTLPDYRKLLMAGLVIGVLLMGGLIVLSTSYPLSVPNLGLQTQQRDPCADLPKLNQQELSRLSRAFQGHQTASTNWFVADMRAVLANYGQDKGSIANIVALTEVILKCQS